MKIYKLSCILFIMLFVRYGRSQDIYAFNYLTNTDGLSQNSVMDIHHDNLGQIWIGTRDGLNKYDGEEFKVFRHQKENKNSISNSDILCIEEDKYGFIWVGTSFGLNRYNPKNNKFKKYFINKKKKFLRNNMIWAIKEMSNNELWIGTSSGILIYDRDEDSFTQILDKKRITSIYETKAGAIFIGTKKGLLRVKTNRKNEYEFTAIAETQKFYVNDIIESENNTILIGTQTNSVLEYNLQTKQILPYFNDTLLKNKNRDARKLLFDDKGFLWIGTYNGLQVSKNKQNMVALYSNDANDNSINDNFIKTLFKDNNGSVWVGTYYGGINIWNNFNNNFTNITQKSSKDGLSFKVVSAIKKYENQLFIGTEGGGITVFDKDTKNVKYLTTKNTDLLKSDNIKALCITKNKKLWIGTFANGVSLYNLKNKVFETPSFPKRLSDILENSGVLSIVQYDEDHILLGTNYRGLVKYNFKNKSFKIFNSNSKLTALTNNNIKTIKVDKSGSIWVGTSSGLNAISRENNITNYTYKSDSRVKFEINTIFEDNNGVLWIGTNEDGLFKFKNNELVSIDLKIGESDINGVRSIVESEDGTFWISTYTQGLLKYNPNEEKVTSFYTNKEGLISNQFNRDASLRVGTSQYYFGGPFGVTYFDEKSLVKNTHTPQVIITDFKINNISALVDKEQGILKNAISYTKEVELDYNQGNFNLSFAIPNFINSGSNSYVYRLKGLESDWIKTSNNYVTYNVQKPGDYTFEVKGINSDGFINEKPTTLNIKFHPAPWLSYWALTLYVLVMCIGSYYLFSVLKSKTRLKYKLYLEQVKAEEVEKTNNSKLEFFTNLSHEFRTPLTLISGPLQQILENYRGSSQMFKKLKVIESSSNQLLQLINRLMDFRKYENELMKLEAAEGNIVKFLKEIFLSFSEYAKGKNYKYSFRSSSQKINLYYDRPKLERVFYNLISNAFKYTEFGGCISVEVEEYQDKVTILINDSGVGIPEEYKDKIFERFFEISGNRTNNNIQKGTGIGLSIVKSIIDLHKGSISVKSNSENPGSVFSVELLKGKSHLKETEIVNDFKFSEDISLYNNQVNDENNLFYEDIYMNDFHCDDKASILLVEDNRELRLFMRNLLSIDYNIFEAENGKEGYRIAISEQIDLIVSDVVMPITSGTELCALVKSDIRTSHIPVVLLTTRSALVYKLEGLERGADDYISKPFNIQEFKLRIANMLKFTLKLKQKLISHDTLQTDDIVLSSLDEKLYKKAIKIIEKNISNADFDIPSFCEELGLSKSVLFIKVKAWTDFTPKQFIQHIRLKRAARYLEQGKISIGQISYKVGFNDQKYFSRIFKSKFGKTPKEYAQSYIEY